jgi:hypothetical protein
MLQLLAAAAASSFIIAATLLLQPHLFSATLFVNLELSDWLAYVPVLHFDWLKRVCVPAAAAAAPRCASRAAADATTVLRNRLLLLLLLHAAARAAVCCCCFCGCCGCCCKQLHYCSHTFLQPQLFSATLFVNVEITHWLADTPVCFLIGSD